jgi:hypothetical protein
MPATAPPATKGENLATLQPPFEMPDDGTTPSNSAHHDVITNNVQDYPVGLTMHNPRQVYKPRLATQANMAAAGSSNKLNHSHFSIGYAYRNTPSRVAHVLAGDRLDLLIPLTTTRFLWSTRDINLPCRCLHPFDLDLSGTYERVLPHVHPPTWTS